MKYTLVVHFVIVATQVPILILTQLRLFTRRALLRSGSRCSLVNAVTGTLPDARQTWWCDRLEAIGQAIGLPWVALAPHFIDNATEGLMSVNHKSKPGSSS